MKKQSFFVFFFLMIISCGGYAQTAINTVDDLRAMVTNGSYYLTEDLEVADWIAFGVFTGTFDGRGHSITVLGSQQDSDGNMGFFAATNGAVISNLVISGWFKDCTGFGGSLVGRAVNTTIVNCETDAEITTNNILAISGGLVGCLDGGCIENCSSNASMEGVKMGGLAGTVKNGASIRNSFSSVSVVYSSKYTTPEVGLLVYNNEGLLENNYVRYQSRGWYLASYEQVCMLFGTMGLCEVNGIGVAWYSGFNLSSSMYASNFYFGCGDMGNQQRKGEGFFGQVNANAKYAHDFNGIGYNVGDFIYIDGLRCFVFYVHEDGRGGWATPVVDFSFKSIVSTYSSLQLEGYYNKKLYIETQNYEYAQWHDGQVATGGTSTVIPSGYDNNPGKFFTHLLQERDDNPNCLINRIQIKSGKLGATTIIKQLAYNNSGVIRYCYYPIATQTYGLVNGTEVIDCCRYEECNAPYNYGEFGPRLYQGNTVSDRALVDTLNGWVRQSDGNRYVTWTVAGSNQINENMPIHRYGFHNGEANVNTAIKKGRTNRHKAMRYASINLLSDDQRAFENTLAYYGDTVPVQADNITDPWPCALYITEEAALKGNYKLMGNVGITLDNSDASGFAGANYDWHSVSTPLSDAPLGIYYSVYTNGGPFNEPSQVRFDNNNGYFPLNTPYTGWDFYCYDEPNNGWPNFKRRTGDHYHHDTGEPINYVNETNLIPGKGYLWAVGKKTGLQAYGTLNRGTVTRAVTREGNIYPGYNLVGNPYHANLDFDVFVSDNNSLLEQNAYVILDADKHGYITYCPGASDNPVYASRMLRAHQGFFVQVKNNGNLQFKPSQTLLGDTAPFRGDRPAYPLVNLMVSDGCGRCDYATMELDRPETGGAFKMKGLRGCDGEISISHDRQEYSIAFLKSRPRTIPVHFSARVDGEYTLRWDFHNEEFGFVHLIDHITGMEVDCLTTDKYVFSASSSDYVSRFKLVFAPAAVEESMAEGSVTSDFAYLSNNTIVIEGMGQLSLFDMQGRLLQSIVVDEYHNGMAVNGLAAGVYVLRLIGPGFSRTQKIILP